MSVFAKIIAKTQNPTNNETAQTNDPLTMAPSLLAGLKGLYGDSGPTTVHGQFIHGTILPVLAKLQRELRSRKHKVRRSCSHPKDRLPPVGE